MFQLLPNLSYSCCNIFKLEKHLKFMQYEVYQKYVSLKFVYFPLFENKRKGSSYNWILINIAEKVIQKSKFLYQNYISESLRYKEPP